MEPFLRITLDDICAGVLVILFLIWIVTQFTKDWWRNRKWKKERHLADTLKDAVEKESDNSR